MGQFVRAIKRGLRQFSGSRAVGLLACALAMALVTLRLDAKSIWWDESLSLLRARSDLATILSARITFGGIVSLDQHPPLYFLGLAAMRALGGESDFSLRLLSALAMVVSVAVTYALARRLLGARPAGGAALLAAASPLLIWYGQEARMYTLATALCLIALYAAWRGMASRSWRWASAALIATAAAAATHYLTVLFTLPALVAIALPYRRAARARPNGHRPRGVRLAVAGVCLAGIAWGVVAALQRRLPDEPLVGREALPLGPMLVDALNSYSLGLSVTLRQAWWIDLVWGGVWALGVAALLLPLFVRGRGRHLPARARRAALLLAAVVAPILGVWLVNRQVPFYVNSRYVMFAAPLFAIAIVRGLTAAKRLAALRLVLALGLAASLGWSLQRYYGDPYYASKEDYAGAARHVMARELPGDLLLVNGPESLAAFEHYYGGHLIPEALPSMTVRLWDLPKALRKRLAWRERVWVVRARHDFSDPDGLLVSWLEQHATPAGTRVLPSSGAQVSVSLYLVNNPLQAVADSAAPSLAEIGPARLLSAAPVAWEGAGHPLSALSAAPPQIIARSGEALGARLSWRLAEPTPDLKVSLRLVRAGLVWAQRDMRPIEGLPSAAWPAKSDATHTLTLTLPADVPPDLYELQVWAYDGETGASWPLVVAGQSERAYLALATVQIEPPHAPNRAWQAPLATLLAPRWGGLGHAAQLIEREALPDQLSPGQPFTVQLGWQWRVAQVGEYQLAYNWIGADGRIDATSSTPLLGPGELSNSATEARAVQALYPLTAPEAPGVYRLHLLVYDPARQRFLALRRGLLPSFGKDLPLGQISVGP